MPAMQESNRGQATLSSGEAHPTPATLKHRFKRSIAPRLVRWLSRAGLTVSRDDVIWCYRTLLRREPESEQAIQAHCRFFRFESLVRAITASPEYAGHQRRVDPSATVLGRAVAVAPEDFDASIQAYLQSITPTKDQLEYIAMHSDRLRDTLTIVRHLMPRGGELLDYCATGIFKRAVTDLLKDVRQTSVAGVNFELDHYADRYGTARYDVCLNTEVLEHLLHDPSHMLYSINRMLKPDGHLLLTTPNALSTANGLQLMAGHAPTLWNQLVTASKPYYDRHNRDWTPFEVERILGEHGFEIVDSFTRDYYDSTRRMLKRHDAWRQMIEQHSTHNHFGDTMFVLARKVQDIAQPVRKSWLYIVADSH